MSSSWCHHRKGAIGFVILLLAGTFFLSAFPASVGVQSVPRQDEAVAPEYTPPPEPPEPKKPPVPEKRPAPDSIRGIYINAQTIIDGRLDGLVDRLLASGGNAVVIDLEKGGGQLTFMPRHEGLYALNPGSGQLDHLPQIVRTLRNKGLYVIARQVVFADSFMAPRKPGWRIRYKNGALFDARWVDPSHPEVQDYNLLVLKEAAEMGFDEVQFDYIRFPAAAHWNLDYRYDEAAQTRWDVINEFLKKARVVADQYGTRLSVDVFGATVWGEVDWKTLGQQIPEMARHVDAIYPMVYPSHYKQGFYGHPDPHNRPYGIVHDSLVKFMEQAGGNAEIRPWLQGFSLYTYRFGEEFMQEQIQAAFDAGLNDFVIWNPRNDYRYSWPGFALRHPDAE